MRTAEFDAYVMPACAEPALWRLLLAVLLVMFVQAGVLAMILVAAYPVIGPLEYFGWVMKLRAPGEPAPALVLLFSFTGLFLGTLLAAAALHGRGPGSLIGPAGEAARAFLLTLAIAVPVYALSLGLGMLAYPPVPNLDPALWLRLLPVALLLVLVQTSAEELFFRGYLAQQLAARFAARWLWMGLPAVLFASGHLAPGTGASWLTVGAALAFALIAADLTERTGNLGAAIALHFLNNTVAVLLVAVKGTITGLALYVTPFGLAEAGARPLPALVDVALLVLLWGVLRRVLPRLT